MEYTQQQIRDLIYGEHGDLTEVDRSYKSSSRWAINYQVVFSDKANPGRLFAYMWDCPATECQESSLDIPSDDPIKCPEMVAVNKIVTSYEPLPG